MKDRKNIQNFSEFNKNLNISDVSESKLLGEFVQNGKFMIIDIIDPDDSITIPGDLYDERYIEYPAYGIDDKKFYLLDSDYEVIEGPYDTIEDLYINIGIEEIPDFNLK
jgi:hypothetical protein